jgi:hypothetical protein
LLRNSVFAGETSPILNYNIIVPTVLERGATLRR